MRSAVFRFLIAIMVLESPLPSVRPIPAPLLLDEIGHYFVRDRAATERFWKDGFGAREMAHPGPRPLSFITFLRLRPGEGSIMVSPPGPYEGMAVGDPNRWRRTVVPPSADRPPVLGVHWVAVRTVSLPAALSRLQRAGVVVRERETRLPADPDVPAALVEDPDHNLVAVVERPASGAEPSPFAFDHLQFLVRSADASARFFTDVFAGEVVTRRAHTTVMRVGGAMLVLSEPEALGLDPAGVRAPDAGTFRYGIEHISFLYSDVKAAFAAARSRGYRFALEPARLQYYGEPTVYSFGYLLSPDGLQCEMVSEDGRSGPRAREATDRQRTRPSP